MTESRASSPALLAHRGYQRLYPENTRESLLAAIEAGAKNIEFDVQLAGDGVPMVVHDDNLKRTAGI
ncbi:MAG: glycerophosphodiester phosphodiesterase family protein, partial [Gammaproteobacteria bacterium]